MPPPAHCRHGTPRVRSWPASAREPGAEQTVRTAARLAGQLNVRWHAAYVETPKLQRLGRAERDRILAVIQLAEQLGADTAVLAGADAAAELVAQAEALNCATLVVGPPRLRPNALPAWLGTWLAGAHHDPQAGDLSPAVDIVEVGRSHSTRRLGSPLTEARGERIGTAQGHASDSDPASWGWSWGYAWALAVSIAMTALATPLVRVLDLANIVMLFLLGVVLVALRSAAGRRRWRLFSTWRRSTSSSSRRSCRFRWATRSTW
jgi:two-component system sensor histidine kinase KdpD